MLAIPAYVADRGRLTLVEDIVSAHRWLLLALCIGANLVWSQTAPRVETFNDGPVKFSTLVEKR
jgi:hypothetical protein